VPCGIRIVIWNWLDWTLVGIVVVSTIAAATKGFVRELISLAALVVGLVVAASGYERAAKWFEDLARSQEIALAFGFLALFFAVMLIGALISAIARKMIKTAGLQSFDRFLGAVFGLVRGVLVDCVLLMAMVAFSVKAEAVQQSELAPYFATGSRVLALVMPRELKGDFQAQFERFRQALIQRDKIGAQK
jgi:membrane protein required for colicin V production